MRSVWQVVAVLGVALGVAGCASGPESDEAASVEAMSPADEAMLALDFEAFDQDMDGGWRTVAAEGRFEDAARLIDAYLDRHSAGLTAHQRVVLNFHAGQMYAMADDRERAVERFEASIDPDAAMRSWNPYVEATIAFLERDREALLAARAAMAATPDGSMNMPVVDRLIEHFGMSYLDALRPPTGD